MDRQRLVSSHAGCAAGLHGGRKFANQGAVPIGGKCHGVRTTAGHGGFASLFGPPVTPMHIQNPALKSQRGKITLQPDRFRATGKDGRGGHKMPNRAAGKTQEL